MNERDSLNWLPMTTPTPVMVAESNYDRGLTHLTVYGV